MSDGDGEPADGAATDEEALGERLETLDGELDAAQTEADLDAIETELDAIEADLEAADLPEADDESDPRGDLEARIEELRGELEEQRGPYAEDAAATAEEAAATVADTRWTDDGESDAAAAVEAFVDRVNEILDTDVVVEPDLATADDALSEAAVAIETADLDPDDDAETVAALVEAADQLTQDLEDAEEWEDLTTREKLQAEGFYEALERHKDFPPEWSALKEWERRGNAEMVLLALEHLGSEFMEEHCLNALKRLGDEAALDTMLQRADRRDKDAIEILGKIGSDEALDTILEYVDTDSDPALQKVTFRALGEIGSEEATQAVANKLVSDNEIIRSHAARTLGLIGDPRAVEPLTDTLDDDDSDTVRASAAWALNQIGTRKSLEVVRDRADDRTFLVQNEAEKADVALGSRTEA